MFQPKPGGRLGAYTILDEIARGGQGVVWRARLATGELLALKILTSTARAEIKRFQQEARILARLAHPNLPRVHDYGEIEGTCFLALELIQGRDLGTVVEQAGPLPVSSAAMALTPIALALDYCHRQGVIHRDVKPSNIVIEAETRRPVLIDFGMVRRDSEQFELSLDRQTAFSLSGTMRGTPEFMAPEQVDERRFGAVSAATDVYGLGGTLFYLLCGACPAAGDFQEVVQQVTEGPPPDPRQVNSTCSPGGAKLTLRALAKDQAARPPTPLAFARELRVLGSLSALSRGGPHLESALRGGSCPPGTRLGNYEVVRELGRGAKGVVLLARDEAQQPVALKVLGAGSGDDLKRLTREGEVLASLQHENIVALLDVLASPTPSLVLEYVEGRDLEGEFRERAPVPPFELHELFRDIATGLAYAHSCGVAHRDLKPANVLVRPEGRALLTDFNLAVSEDSERFTQTGTLLGTPAYMSPEQATGRKAGPKADVWAWGIMLYEGLTGSLPYEASSLVALRAEIMRADFPRPRSPLGKIPAYLESLCLSCLHKDPARRPSAAELSEALTKRQARGGGAAKGAIAAALLALALLALGGWALARPSGNAPGETPTPAATASLALATPTPQAAPTLTPTPTPQEIKWPSRWRLSESEESPPLSPRPEQWPELGRRAEPLRPLRLAKLGAELDCFFGLARALGGGQVAVQFTSKSLSLEASRPSGYFETGDAEPVVSGSPGKVRLRAVNDTTHWEARLGEAHWATAEVSFSLRVTGPADIASLRVNLGAGQEQPLALALDGRSQRLALTGTAGDPPAAEFKLDPEEANTVLFSPGAAAGRRLILKGEVQTELERFLDQPASPGPVTLGFGEVDYSLSTLQIAGRPTRPGRPALAKVPLHRVGARVEVRARYTGEGVPFVGLGRVRLAVEAGELILSEGRRIALRTPLVESQRERGGELRLRRAEDRLVGTHVSPKGRVTTCELWRPLPERGQASRVTYGALEGLLNFEEVEVREGPPDPFRAAYDAPEDLAEAEQVLRAAPRSTRQRWLLGSLLLARVSVPDLAEIEAVVGQSPEAAQRRRTLAQEAASLLANERSGFEGRDRDGLARGVLAATLGGRSETAASFASRLRAEHPKSGVATLDGLYRLQGRPLLLECLSDGLVSVHVPQVPEAAFRALMELDTNLRLDGLVGLAGHLRAVRSPRVAEGIPLLDEALEKGYEPVQRALLAYADILTDLKRYEEAIERWDACAKNQGRYWWIWLRRGHCLASVGRMAAAVESYLISVGIGRHPVAQRELGKQLRWLDQEQYPGLAAAALLVLHRLGVEPQAALRADAERLARGALGRIDREGALGAYVLAALEASPPPALPPGDLPEAVLARARAQHPPSRTKLDELADEHRLVGALADLDPDLHPLVR